MFTSSGIKIEGVVVGADDYGPGQITITKTRNKSNNNNNNSNNSKTKRKRKKNDPDWVPAPKSIALDLENSSSSILSTSSTGTTTTTATRSSSSNVVPHSLSRSRSPSPMSAWLLANPEPQPEAETQPIITINENGPTTTDIKIIPTQGNEQTPETTTIATSDGTVPVEGENPQPVIVRMKVFTSFEPSEFGLDKSFRPTKFIYRERNRKSGFTLSGKLGLDQHHKVLAQLVDDEDDYDHENPFTTTCYNHSKPYSNKNCLKLSK